MAAGAGGIRLARVAIFALVAVGLTIAAHAAAGGRVSPVAGVVAVGGVTLLLHPLAARRRRLRSLLPVLGLLQVVLHSVFSALSGAAAYHFSTPTTGHVHSALPMMTDGAAMSGHAGTPGMVFAHAAATVLAAAILARGESVLWALIAALGFVFVLDDVTRALPAAAGRSLPAVAPVLLVSMFYRRVRQRRGPPAPHLAAA